VGCILAELLELLEPAVDRRGDFYFDAPVVYGQKTPRVIFSHQFDGSENCPEYEWQKHVIAIFKVLAPLSVDQLHRMNENGGEKDLLRVTERGAPQYHRDGSVSYLRGDPVPPAKVIAEIQDLIRRAQQSGGPPAFSDLFKRAGVTATNLLQRMLQFLAGALHPLPSLLVVICAFFCRLPRRKSWLQHQQPNPFVCLSPHLLCPTAEDRISMHGAHVDAFHYADYGNADHSNQVSDEEVGDRQLSGLLPAFGFETALGFECGQ
jgi:hypothetical protein